MEKTVTGKTPLKRMTKLTFALPAAMAFTLAMPAFSQDQGAQPQEPGKQKFGRFHGRQGRGGSW